jgi:CRP-like cAMP-binding protein
MQNLIEVLPSGEVTELKTRKDRKRQRAALQPGLYSVIAGTIAVERNHPDGTKTVLGIHGVGEFFGESSLAGAQRSDETAVAVVDSSVMFWPEDRIRTLSRLNPHITLALLGWALRRSEAVTDRVVSLATMSIEQRFGALLLELSERIGAPCAGGAELPGFTHEILADYIGTSREIVTHCMNDFRREGLIGYSRRGITVFDAARKVAA